MHHKDYFYYFYYNKIKITTTVKFKYKFALLNFARNFGKRKSEMIKPL